MNFPFRYFQHISDMPGYDLVNFQRFTLLRMDEWRITFF